MFELQINLWFVDSSVEVEIDLDIGGVAQHGDSVGVERDSAAQVLNHERQRPLHMLEISYPDRGGLVG